MKEADDGYLHLVGSDGTEYVLYLEYARATNYNKYLASKTTVIDSNTSGLTAINSGEWGDDYAQNTMIYWLLQQGVSRSVLAIKGQQGENFPSYNEALTDGLSFIVAKVNKETPEESLMQLVYYDGTNHKAVAGSIDNSDSSKFIYVYARYLFGTAPALLARQMMESTYTDTVLTPSYDDVNYFGRSENLLGLTPICDWHVDDSGIVGNPLALSSNVVVNNVSTGYDFYPEGDTTANSVHYLGELTLRKSNGVVNQTESAPIYGMQVF